jgi:hypothetical protein
MADISLIVEGAYLSRATWTHDAFASALKTVQQAVGRGQIDWDSAVPENWGTVNDNGDVLAVVCRILPIVVYLASLESTVEHVINAAQIRGIRMRGWESRDFAIQPDVLRRCFDIAQIPESIDIGRFSAADLWYVTVT